MKGGSYERLEEKKRKKGIEVKKRRRVTETVEKLELGVSRRKQSAVGRQNTDALSWVLF